MRRLAVLLFATACSFEHGAANLGGPDAAGSRDATGDAPACSFSSQFDTCSLGGASAADLVLTGPNTYSTDTGVLLAGSTTVAITHMQVLGKAGGMDAIIVHDFHMNANATLRATGSVPLAIVAYGSIALDGGARIDVTNGGAGARSGCPDGPATVPSASGGAGGGGGGGFGAAGGAGGDGDSDGTTKPGGAGGAAVAMFPAGPLGGCPGANGGDGDKSGGAGGLGGGAIYLVAATQISLASNAGIDAGGGGGEGGHQSGGILGSGDAGGGGGGSGGMIFIEAATIRSMGMLAANGGGGGEGSDSGGGGNSGQSGQLSITAAKGGSGGTGNGGDGAAGGTKGAAAGLHPTDFEPGGGGGGGGGVGFVIVRSPDQQVSATSPDPS